MASSVDDKLIELEASLRRQRNDIVNKKIQLLNSFRSYALTKVQEIDRTFEIEYNEINGIENALYTFLNIGDDANVIHIYLKFNPKTGIISDYSKSVFRGKKFKHDYAENKTMPGNSHSVQTKAPHYLKDADDIDKSIISRELNKKTDELLIRIFKGRLMYEDDEFKRLVDINAAIELELQRLDSRIEALSTINGSSDMQVEKRK